MNWLLRHRYLVLLVALMLLLVIYPLLHDVFKAALLYNVLLTAVTFAAVLAIFAQRRVRLIGPLLTIPGYPMSLTPAPRLYITALRHFSSVLGWRRFCGPSIATRLSPPTASVVRSAGI